MQPESASPSRTEILTVPEAARRLNLSQRSVWVMIADGRLPALRFLYDGKTWRSLSAIAKDVSGTSWNGFLFFGIQTRAKAPAAQKSGAQ
jgi:excisionase family DNA binding protein